MLTSSEDLDAEVAGSTVGDLIELYAWRGADLAHPDPLGISSWSMTWDASRRVQGQGTVVVADPDGTLAPWGMGDALAPGGSRLAATWVSGMSGTRVPWERWRIRGATPREQWRAFTQGRIDPAGTFPGAATFPNSETYPGGQPGVAGLLRRVSGGGSVSVAFDDEMSSVVLERLDGEGTPPVGATCVSELRRLLDGLLAVSIAPDVTDRPVPSDLTYQESRADVVAALVAWLGCGYRMGQGATLEVVSLDETDPVWTIAGGPDGVLIDVTRALSDDGVYNGIRSTSQQPDKIPLVGRATIDGGPLVWGGPYGRVIGYHNSASETQAGVDADAATELARMRAAGQVILPVECLSHPGLQLHDWVQVIAPTVAGDAGLTGRVVSIARSTTGSSGGVVMAKRMSVGVAVSVEALEVVAWRVARG